MKKYIFGHKNPDTDTIVSSILYAEFLTSLGEDVEAVSLGEMNQETKFVMEKFGVSPLRVVESLPEGSCVVLMDHNERKQCIDNIDELEVVTVIDHHRFDFSTAGPLNIRAEPLGSTCSILYKMFLEQGYEITKDGARLLITGIISDTLFFRSPTTTSEDRAIVDELNKMACVEDLEAYSMEMFNAKSDLGDICVKKMIKMDYKEFLFGGKKYGVGVIETTNPDYVFGRKDEIVKALAEIKEADNLVGVMVSVIDIINEENKTIVTDSHEAEILMAVFRGEEIEHNVYSLGNIVSRKKQMVPHLEKHLA